MLAPEPEVVVAAADKRRAAHHGAAAVRDVALGHLDRVQVSSKPFRYVNYHQTVKGLISDVSKSIFAELFLAYSAEI